MRSRSRVLLAVASRRFLSASANTAPATAAAAAAASKEPILLKSTLNGVMTLTMNNTSKLNGWTEKMLTEIFAGFEEAKKDDNIKVLVLTANGKFYSAGVDLSSTFKLQHPQKMWEFIRTKNQYLFDQFLDFPKPLLVAVNGTAIGASVTSATLSDGIIAAETAGFITPFHRLGVPPEGCSSVHFARIMHPTIAHKMLYEDVSINAVDAKKAGFVFEVVPLEKLHTRAQQVAEQWIVEKKQRVVSPDLKQVNAAESKEVANAFLSTKFLQAQADFMTRQKKTKLAFLFNVLVFTHPLWKLFLSSSNKTAPSQ